MKNKIKNMQYKCKLSTGHSLLWVVIGVFGLILMLSCDGNKVKETKIYTSFKPGELWLDSDSVHINAHGGGILVFKDTYYWFGEHKTGGRGGNKALQGIRCYSSTDLYNWKNEGIALSTVDEEGHDIEKGAVMERPKVIYNKANKQLKMFRINSKSLH